MWMLRRSLPVILALALLAAGCEAPGEESGSAPPSSRSGEEAAAPVPSEETPAESAPESASECAPAEYPGGEGRADGLPVFPAEAVGEDTPASFLGKTFGEVTAFCGEDYRLDQRNSLSLTYELEDGGSLVFHCSAPGEQGVFDADDPVTFVTVDGAPGLRVTRDISLGMTREEAEAAMPEGLEAAPAEGPGSGNQLSWYGELNGSLCRVYLTFGEDGALRTADIKGEELMAQLTPSH